MAYMRPENRLCLWCQFLEQDAGSLIGEETWECGSIRCGKDVWSPIIGETELNDVDSPLYTKFKTAQTCPKFELNCNLEQIVGDQK